MPTGSHGREHLPENEGLQNMTEMLHEIRELNGRECDVRSHALEPRVSFIVPIYNAASTLEWALASLLAQDGAADIEIVCVDDASTDESCRMIDRHVDDPRFTVVSHRVNAGYGASMNDGIAVARAPWIGILEPDDYVLSEMVSSLMDVARLEDCDIIKTPYIRELRDEGVPRGGVPREHLQCNYRYRVHPRTPVFTMADPGVVHLLRHHPSIWSALYSKDFLERNDIRFHEYPGAGWADNEFFYDTLLRGRICYVDEPFYVYREETPLEADAFRRADKTLPFERWQFMQDIIERTGIEGEHVQRAHVSKGFKYLLNQLASNGDDPEVAAAANSMFDRMDPGLVEKELGINPDLKRRFNERRGISKRIVSLPYKASLVGEFAYTVRSNGFDYAKGLVKDRMY